MRAWFGFHTIIYLLSVSAVMAAALNPNGTARFLRRHTSKVVATVRNVSETATSAPIVAASEIKRPSSASQGPTRDRRLGQYRVAIGTVLTARLRSAINSGTAQANDQIDAVLSDAVKQDDVELIPSGSILHGVIVQAEAATKEAPRGRVEIIFTVVQHADTRSRAAIRTRPLIFEAEPPADSTRAKRVSKKQPIDVALPAGHPLMLALSDTLLVYIPNAR